jgi:hypothetical protein
MSKLSEKTFASIFNRSGELGVDRLTKAIHSTGDDMLVNHHVLQGCSFGMKQHERFQVHEAILAKNNLHKHSLDILHHFGNENHKASIKKRFPGYKPSKRDDMTKRSWKKEVSDIESDAEIRSNGFHRK